MGNPVACSKNGIAGLLRTGHLHEMLSPHTARLCPQSVRSLHLPGWNCPSTHSRRTPTRAARRSAAGGPARAAALGGSRPHCGVKALEELPSSRNLDLKKEGGLAQPDPDLVVPC